jgi:hypothetical protein
MSNIPEIKWDDDRTIANECLELAYKELEALSEYENDDKFNFVKERIAIFLKAYGAIRKHSKSKPDNVLLTGTESHILCSAFFKHEMYDIFNEIHPYSQIGQNLLILAQTFVILKLTDELMAEISLSYDEFFMDYGFHPDLFKDIEKNLR